MEAIRNNKFLLDAENYLENNDLNSAFDIYLEMLKEDSNNVGCLTKLLEISVFQNNGDNIILFANKILEIEPDNFKAIDNLSDFLLYKKKFTEVLNFLESKMLISNNSFIINKFCVLINKLPNIFSLHPTSKENSVEKFIELISICLSNPNVEYSYLNIKINDIFGFHKFFKYFFVNDVFDINSAFLDFIEDDFVILSLSTVILKDYKTEKMLSIYRKYLLKKVLQRDFSDKIESIYALAYQCYYNEFIYFVDEEEKELILKLKNNLNSEYEVVVYACYEQINLNFDFKNEMWNKLFKFHVENNKIEEEIKKNISILFKEKNITTKEVKSMYEENPYPRWINTYFGKRQEIKKNITYSFPELRNHKFIKKDKYELLIAGCGTGKEIFQYLGISDVNITAIDISSSSIAYAKRKLQEYNVNNVEIYLADILELDKYDKKFDIVISSGVLHHLKEPMQGFKNLYNLLNKNGFMRIGLYSEIARKSVIEIISYLKNNNEEYSLDLLRELRKKIHELPDSDEMKKIMFFGDFYSTSTCRDLLFHVQESRFTIPMIENFIKEYNLSFLGFLLNDSGTLIKFLEQNKNFSEKTNLKKWHKFEVENPTTFQGMYQFGLFKN